MNSHRTGITFAEYFKKNTSQKADLDTSSSICSSSCEEGEFRPKFWLDSNEVQLTQQIQQPQHSFSPSHKATEDEIIILSDDSEVNEKQKEIQERRWGMKSDYFPLKDNNNKINEENHKHKGEYYNKQDKHYKHKRRNLKKEMHHHHHRCHKGTCKGKYIQQKTKRDDKYAQHYKHKKHEHKKEQRYKNDNKPKFSPIKNDNCNEKNISFVTVNNKYNSYKERKYYQKTNKGESLSCEHKDIYYSHDKRKFADKESKIRHNSKERYYMYN